MGVFLSSVIYGKLGGPKWQREINVQETIQSDFSVVVNDIAEELLTRLNMDEDGSVIDMFQTGSFDPWQLFVLFWCFRKSSY